MIVPSTDPLQVIFVLTTFADNGAGCVICSDPLSILTHAIFAASRIWTL